MFTKTLSERIVMKLLARIMTLCICLLVSTITYAGKRNLITMTNGVAMPSLAKSWTKEGEGVYSFVLDLEKSVKKGRLLTPEMVKKSLEKKLGNSLKLSVDILELNKIKVTYSGGDEVFFAKIAKARIRSIGGTEIALESSVSDGGIRANKALRPLKNGEVMATVTRVNGTYYKAVVTNSKSKILQKGKFEAAIPMGVSIKKGNTLIFTPSDTKVWRANKKNEFLVN
jgi:hypothetical protein